jgi:hypothetical protein
VTSFHRALESCMFSRTSYHLLTSLILSLGAPSFLFAQWEPVESFTTDDEGNFPVIASDANGNAMAVFIDSGATSAPQASYFTAGTWGAFQFLDSPGALGDIPAVAMDPTGTALAVWKLDDTTDIRGAFFDGSSWQTAQTVELNSGINFLSFFRPALSVAMNGPGQGVAAWPNANDGQVHASFFTGSSWQTPVPIGAGTVDPSISYSTNGSVIAGWLNDTGSSVQVFVNNYIGGSWQAPQLIGTTGFPFPSSVGTGIDANGNGIMVWIDPSSNVTASYFNGTSWQTPVVIGTDSSSEGYVSVAMIPNGKAIVTWGGFSASFDGTAWSPAIAYSPPGDAPGSALFLYPGSSVSMDSAGNAFVVWLSLSQGNMVSTSLPAGATAWSSPEVIGPESNGLITIGSSLSDNGTAFMVWADTFGEGGGNAFGSAAPGLFPPVPPGPTPQQISGRVCKNKFATASDRVKIITWTASTNPNAVAYRLTRNGVLIATIPASGPFTYRDHHRCKHSDVYIITTVDTLGQESNPLTVTIK